jgi:hypothetical protein
MKTVSLAFLLVASLAFVLTGCSDSSAPVAAPTNQGVQAQGSLEKNSMREFNATMYPTGVLPEGFTNTPDGKTIARGLMQTIMFNVTYPDGRTDLPDFLSGTGVLEVNFTLDFAAGVGESWGQCTLPRETFGGEWKFSWHGKATLGPEGWIIPLNELGHGNGGALTGMKVTFDHTITAAADLSSWSGAGNGVINTH